MKIMFFGNIKISWVVSATHDTHVTHDTQIDPYLNYFSKAILVQMRECFP